MNIGEILLAIVGGQRAHAAALARVEARLENALEELRDGGRVTEPDPSRAALLEAAWAACGGASFTARWLTELADDDARLAAAVGALVGARAGDPARCLGAFLRRAVGSRDGWHLERAGQHRDGVLYRVLRLGESRESPP
jgi:hypothetical protein